MCMQDYMVYGENQQMYIETEEISLSREIIYALVAERKRQRLTQQDIAERTGMKAPNITRVESCKRVPTLDVLTRYAMALGKRVDFSLMDRMDAIGKELNVNAMYELSSDEMAERQCRARRDYYKQVNTHNRTVRELEEAHAEIERLRKRIAELEGEKGIK